MANFRITFLRIIALLLVSCTLFSVIACDNTSATKNPGDDGSDVDPLESLDFKGMMDALNKINFKSCINNEN